jgi:CheY-like chemotaxis protein
MCLSSRAGVGQFAEQANFIPTQNPEPYMPEPHSESFHRPNSDLQAPVYVLVVDDSAIHRATVTAVLEEWGIDTTVALDGAEAVQLLAKGQKFDLILMDVQMPVMDGITATGRIRDLELARRTHNNSRVPIIAFTSEDLQTDAAHLRKLGLDDALPKQFSVSQMRACVERWCPGRLAQN